MSGRMICDANHSKDRRSKKPRSGWGVNLPANLRHAESEVKRAQEVWKLSGAGSVGSQALTGIAALEGLRDHAGAQVLPFETLGEGRSHVLAEIYPSLIRIQSRARGEGRAAGRCGGRRPPKARRVGRTETASSRSEPDAYRRTRRGGSDPGDAGSDGIPTGGPGGILIKGL